MQIRPKPLDVLTSMFKAQDVQFQQATVIAIGAAMTKLGVTELAIEEADIQAAMLKKIRLETLPNGGYRYVLEDSTRVQEE